MIYLVAAVAEIALNYTAFQLMGNSLKETMVLSASIILVNVLLPKQLGELVTRVRRGRRDRGVLVAGLVAGTLLWVGVSLWNALVNRKPISPSSGPASGPHRMVSPPSSSTTTSTISSATWPIPR